MSMLSIRKDLVKKYYQPAEIVKNNPPSQFEYTLKIVIPGPPVSDGRPRLNKETEKFYNEKKVFLCGIFEVMYKMDALLRKTCIVTPHRIRISTYTHPTKAELRYLLDDEVLSDLVDSIGAQDNDNIEKVNWDVLQASQFMIILNDSYTIQNQTHKYYSYHPRTEIYIDYDTYYKSKLYEHKITSSMEYRMFLCSYKYTKDINEWEDLYIAKYLAKRLPDLNSTASKKIDYILRDYSAIVIDNLFKYLFFGNKMNDKIEMYLKSKKKAEKLFFIINVITTSSKNAKKLVDTLYDDVDAEYKVSKKTKQIKKVKK